MNMTLVTDNRAAGNTGFASGGVTPFRASRGRLCKLGAYNEL